MSYSGNILSTQDCSIMQITVAERLKVFKYARAVKQKVWNEAENRERDWGETLKIFLSPHTPCGHVRLASFARVRLLRHVLLISLLILRKKPTVLQSIMPSTFVFFPWTSIQSLALNSRKYCQHLTNWTRWNKQYKVCSRATSLFKWCFRSCGCYRRCCFRSALYK